ncbi:MAG: hypothetical protein ABI430_04575 [Candidatus Taylorbacteria bacterium]
MHNLLLEKNKRDIEREYWFRLTIIFLFLLSVLGVILFIALIPSYIFAGLQEKSALEKKQTGEQSAVSVESRNLDLLFKETTNRIAELGGEGSSLSLHEIIALILKHKNSSIRIEGFTFEPEKDKTRALSLQGIAASRDSLVSFRNDLGQEKDWQVSLPDSNFAKQSQIDFNLELIIPVR